MNRFSSILILSLALPACSSGPDPGSPTKDEIRDQGKADSGVDWCEELGWYGDGVCDDFCLQLDSDCASDSRRPELGDDPTVVLTSKVSMADGIAQTARDRGPVIEAKFELGDDGKLSLSTYPVGKSFATDAEQNIFQEQAGDPTVSPMQSAVEQFHDQEHLTRSARDLTLAQLSSVSLLDAVKEVEDFGFVYWAIPTIQEGRAGFGIWQLVDDETPLYWFIDGAGSSRRGVQDLGTGPGTGATDARTPELGDDVTVVRTAKVKMSSALSQVLASTGPAIEAKYEIGDDGKLSLSIYPVTDIKLDAEQQTFVELAGDPTTGTTFFGTSSTFAVPDEEHLTRSARDLTLVQTASMTLLQAVQKAESRFPGGFVYWAIPTRRDTRAGYGIYVLDSTNRIHYLFVS